MPELDPTSRCPRFGRRAFGISTLAALLVPSCSKGGGAAQPFRFSGIPDADKTELSSRYAAVADYLTARLGRPAQYVHVPDYTAAVTALAAGKVEAAWLGGVTAVQADNRAPKGVEFVAARPQDLEFRSYFVAKRSWLEHPAVTEVLERKPQPLSALASLAPALAKGTFSFGARSSTSGHVMPRWFLKSDGVGVHPETGFAAPPLYQLKGGHSATLRAVASGAVDFGVLNYGAWEAADEATQRAAPVIYVTPPYVDYCFVARADPSGETNAAFKAALLQLDSATSGHADVLAAFGTDRFVAADKQDWEQIRSVLADVDLQDGGG